MAVAPEGEDTLFAFLGGLRIPEMGLLDLLLRPAARPPGRSRCAPSGGWNPGS